jgi:competence protein ComEA
LFLLLCLTLLGWHTWNAQQRSCRPTILEAEKLSSPSINLNEADHAQLLQLPHIGENLAQRIEIYRREKHGFRHVDELRSVPGIGPALLAKLRPFVYVQSPATDEAAEPLPLASVAKRNEKPNVASAKSKQTLPARIDINHASAEELRRLPGIGPILSQRILETRAKKPFRTMEDLRRVPGIGPQKLQALRPHVVIVP